MDLHRRSLSNLARFAPQISLARNLTYLWIILSPSMTFRLRRIMFPAQCTACFSRLSKGSDSVSAAVCGIQDTDRDPLLPLGSMPSRVPVLYDLELPDDFTS